MSNNLRNLGDRISVPLQADQIQPSAPQPIRYYREKQLETEVVCGNCTLRYAIYGVFGWCPDCGVHNSLQILLKNLERASKELALAETVDNEMAHHLVGDAFEKPRLRA